MGLFFCDKCQQAPDGNGHCLCDRVADELRVQNGEAEDERGEPCTCDCCPLCVEGSCCGSYPEYCCMGYCGHRGEPGHRRADAPDPRFPELSFPERGATPPARSA